MWTYFTTSDTNRFSIAVCLACRKHMSDTSSTATLMRHIKLHGLDDKNQMAFTLSGGIQLKPFVLHDYTLERITVQLCRWITASPLPFRTVENGEFVKLLQYFDPQYKVMSRTTIRHQILSKYRNSKEYVSSMPRREPGKISFTCDA